MSGVTVVKQVVAEVRGKTDQLDRDMAAAEQRLGRTKRAIEGNAAAAGALGSKYAGAAQQIASATENISRAGTVTGEAAKQILFSGSQIAFAFGTGGAVVGALSVFALAAAQAFQKARDEARSAREEIERTQRLLLQNRDVSGAARQVTRLLAGDAESDDPNRRAGLLRLRERLAREREALLASAPDPSIRRTAAEIAARNAQVQSVRDLATAVATLEAEYRTAEGTYTTLAQQDVDRQQNLATLAAEEREAGAASKERAKDVAEAQRLIAEATKAADAAIAAFNLEVADFGRAFEGALLRELGSQVDQVASEFDALIRQGEAAVGATDPRILLLRGLRDAAVEAAAAIEASQATLRGLDLADGADPTQDTFVALEAAAERLRRTLARLTPESRAYKAVQEELLRLEQRRGQLLTGLGDAGPAGGDGAARPTADLARDLQQAVDGALQLGQALGAANARAVDLLRSIGQIAGNLPALQQALATGTGAGVIGAALPIVGALATLIGDNPAEQARREALQRNTEAIRELTARAGLLGVGLSGGNAQRALADLAKFNLDGPGPIRGGPGLGVDLANLRKAAAAVGLEFEFNTAFLKQLRDALRDTISKLGEFGTDLASALQQADAEAQIFGISDPVKRLQLTLAAFNGRSTAFDRVTAGLDLTTAEGREQARKNAQALFDILRAGGDRLDSSEFLGLQGQELLDAILRLVSGLDAVDESLGLNKSTATKPDQVVVADRTQITADQASRLLGLSQAQLTELRLIRDALVASRVPLPLPSAAVFAGAAAAGPVVTINQTIDTLVLSAANPGAAAQQFSEESLAYLTEHIRRALGRDVQVRAQYAGAGVRS